MINAPIDSMIGHKKINNSTDRVRKKVQHMIYNILFVHVYFYKMFEWKSNIPIILDKQIPYLKFI